MRYSILLYAFGSQAPEMILDEYEFVLRLGPHTEVFCVEELLPGQPALWPGRYRIRLPATHAWNARTFYGKNCLDVVSQVADFFAAHYGVHPGRAAHVRKSRAQLPNQVD
jgi:hypothetical protein